MQAKKGLRSDFEGVRGAAGKEFRMILDWFYTDFRLFFVCFSADMLLICLCVRAAGWCYCRAWDACEWEWGHKSAIRSRMAQRYGIRYVIVHNIMIYQSLACISLAKSTLCHQMGLFYWRRWGVDLRMRWSQIASWGLDSNRPARCGFKAIFNALLAVFSRF